MKKSIFSFLVGASLLIGASPSHAIDPNEPIDIQKMQNDLMSRTGLTRSEGMVAFKLFNECRLRGWPVSRVWANCMQPAYALGGNMPRNPQAALQFAMQQTCINAKTYAQGLVCMNSFYQ